ncbi:MAG: recombinase A [Acidobacteria bacterium]|nr:recombinase A [Acidobacteriota bacterium]
MANAAELTALVSASRSWLQRRLAAPAPAAWTAAALGGCLAELAGTGAAPSLTLAMGLVREAQREDEPVAWITRAASTFFPPDAAEGGVDLAGLPVIRLDGLRQRLRAADRLARSGAFGLLVVDLGDCLDLPLAVQTRLAEQALAHGTLILCLTEKTERQPSLGSLVAVRGQARCIRHGPDRFACRVQALKDKRRGPGWTDQEWCRGPDGLR